MALTPMDIHNKEFRRSFRGYNDDEVDEFLDDVVADYERIYKENMELKERITTLEGHLKSYKNIEKTLNETLILAQKTAEEVIDNAKNKAEMIVQNAEEDGRRIIQEANVEIIHVSKDIEENKKNFEIFKSRLKVLLESQLEMIQKEDFFDQDFDQDDEEVKG